MSLYITDTQLEPICGTSCVGLHQASVTDAWIDPESIMESIDRGLFVHRTFCFYYAIIPAYIACYYLYGTAEPTGG